MSADTPAAAPPSAEAPTAADGSAPDLALAAAHLRQALHALGFPDDPELVRTPEQVAGLWAELRGGAVPGVEPLPTRSDALVVVRELPFESLCAHHLLPFFGTVTIAYRPSGAIAGLGWFPRLVDALARRPQLQERLADQLAETVHEALGCHAVGVKLVARQMCVELRGARARADFELRARRGGPDAELDRALG